MWRDGFALRWERSLNFFCHIVKSRANGAGQWQQSGGDLKQNSQLAPFGLAAPADDPRSADNRLPHQSASATLAAMKSFTLLALLLAATQAQANPLPADAPFREEIARFAEMDRFQSPPACPLLFVGSSSMRLWTTLREDMAPLPVINRGFGGSTIAQANLYFDRLVAPYRPRAIVFYSGENDIDSGATPETAIASFRRFMALKDQHLGTTPVFYIAAKPSKLRLAQLPRQTALNTGIKAMAQTRPDLHFIDIVPAMMDGGAPKDLFVADGLHMTQTGYSIWRDKVVAALTEAGIPDRACD